jgi:hypothetical protein
VDPEVVLSWVRPSRSEIQFRSAKAGSDELTLTNRGAGAATLIMQYADMPGLEVKLDRTEIKKGEAARLTARWAPGKIPPPSTIPVQILIEPTGQLVTLLVSFVAEAPK